MAWVSALRELIVATCLLYAAYSDIKTREISDSVWVIMCVLAAPLVFFELPHVEFKIVLSYVVSSYLGFLLGLIVSSLGLMGWGDFLALSCVGLTTLPRGEGAITAVPAVAVLVNSLIVSMLYPVYLLLRNLMIYRKRGKLFDGVKAGTLVKVVALFTLTKVSVDEYLKRKEFYSIAETSVKGERRIVLSPQIRGAELVRSDGKEVWVSPHVPFVAMIALGYLIYVLFGCPFEFFIGLGQG